MRKVLALSAVALALTQPSVAQNNKQEVMEGNGKLVTRTVDVRPFDALKASGVYELRLSQGSSESVRIEADENLHELFEVRNDGSKLVISMKDMKNKSLKSKNKMRVHVTFKKLTGMELSTVGNVRSEDRLSFDELKLSNRSVGNVDLELTANRIDVENTSVGNITLSGKAEHAVVRNSGVGNFKAGDFAVQTVSIDNSGVGSAEVNAAKELKVNDNWLGKVKNKGAATVKKRNKVVI